MGQVMRLDEPEPELDLRRQDGLEAPGGPPDVPQDVKGPNTRWAGLRGAQLPKWVPLAALAFYLIALPRLTAMSLALSVKLLVRSFLTIARHLASQLTRELYVLVNEAVNALGIFEEIMLSGYVEAPLHETMGPAPQAERLRSLETASPQQPHPNQPFGWFAYLRSIMVGAEVASAFW